MKGLIVIPAYNEEGVIASVIKKIPSKISAQRVDYLVVNDGSTDNTEEVLRNIRANYVSHPINRGLGAALGTGFEYARNNGYNFLVTLDGDGQHDPSEIREVLEPVLNGQADFVIGTRVYKKGMPFSRRLLTFFASIATYFFTGVWTTDSQSGFRAFSKKAIQNINIEVNRMEVSSEFFYLTKINNLKFKEVQITPIYTKYSLAKGQDAFNSFNILGKLFLRRIIN